VLGFIAAYIIWKNGESDVGASLLYMAVFGAVISYFMQCISFILLRRNMPDIRRPYRSPMGVPGAAIAAVIALCSLGAILYNDEYRPGVYGVLIVYLVALAYFGIAGRNKLVFSPEEEFAMTMGEKGHPEEGGYGHSRMEALEEPHDFSETKDQPSETPPPRDPPGS
jgi:ethanolamine permease